MKLSANIPLTPKIEAGLLILDDYASQKVSARNRLSALYAEKTSLANDILHQGAQAPDWLQNEAGARGISVDDLCRLIIENNNKAKSSLLSIEQHRQYFKEQMRNAKSEQEIASLSDIFKTLEV